MHAQALSILLTTHDRLDSLTSLRFIAALAVVLHHFDFWVRSPSPELQYASDILFEGYNGVTFFFVLSGFIISFTFAGRRKRHDDNLADFLVFRLARIYPVHLLTFIIAFVMIVIVDGHYFRSMLMVVSNMLLLHAAIPDLEYTYSFNGVSWSISVELFFYLGFCLIAFASTKRLTFIWFVLATIVVLNLAVFDPNGPTGPWLIYINPLFRFLDFVSGMLLFRLFASSRLSLSPGIWTWLEIASLCLVVAFMSIAITYRLPLAWRWDVYYLIPMASLIFVFAHQGGQISRWLSSRPIVLLGEASFALYMVHQIVINLALRVFAPEDIVSPVAAIGISAVIIGVAVLTSVLLHLYFERPVNVYLRRYWITWRSGRSGPRASAA